MITVEVARASGFAVVNAPGWSVTLLPAGPVSYTVIAAAIVTLTSTSPAPTITVGAPPAVASIQPLATVLTAIAAAPVVTAGGATISSAVVTIAAASPAPSLLQEGAATIAPVFASLGTAAPAPTLSVGGVSLGASITSVAAIAPAPVLSLGGVTIGPAAVTIASAAPSPVVSVASAYDPDATAYFAAMTVQPDTTRKGLLNTLVAGLKTDGVWAKLDRLALTAAHDAQAARLDARNPAKVLSAINSPTFTVDRGYAGDSSTSYLDFGEAFGASGNGYSLNSATIGAWVNLQGAGNGVKPPIGCTTTSTAHVQARNNTGNANFRVNDATTTASETNPTTRVGHRTATRTSLTVKEVYLGGALLVSATVNSTAMPTANGCGLRDGASYSNDRVAVLYSGAGLSAADIANLHARLSTFLTAIGAN